MRAILLILTFELKFLGWLYKEYIKIAKIVVCSTDFLWKHAFDGVLAIFHYYGYGATSSEAVEKIATDEIRVSQRLLLCFKLWIAAAY